MKKKLVLLDMDGTVYLGDKLFDCVPKVFEFLNKNEIEFVFLTNNSSHSVDFYIEKMNRLGIKCDKHNFYTSIDTTIVYLKDHNLNNLFVLGITPFKEILKKEFNLVEKYDKNVKVDAVLASFDTELTYEELKDASLYIQDGAKFLATNMDYRCPIEGGKFVPDCGGLCKWLELTTDVKPLFLGKPAPEMIYQVEKIFNVKPEEVILVGDRHYTDIMAGINAGIDTVGVLSGETSEEEYLKAEKKPTYIEKDIGSLIEILS